MLIKQLLKYICQQLIQVDQHHIHNLKTIKVKIIQIGMTLITISIRYIQNSNRIKYIYIYIILSGNIKYLQAKYKNQIYVSKITYNNLFIIISNIFNTDVHK